MDVQSKLKRLSDIILSVIGLLLAWPVLILIAVLVKLDSRGPALFSQVRVGQNQRVGNRVRHWGGKPRRFSEDERMATTDRRREGALGKNFTMLKFRTMRADSPGSAASPAWSSLNDSRITRIGRLLRRSHLDEVPQLFNVLMGDMSLVGPRPEQPQFVMKLAERLPSYPARLAVKPGLTGLAQIRHRQDLGLNDVRKKVRYDRLYINSWSFFTDMKIIFGTVPKVFGSGSGETLPDVSRLAGRPLSLEEVFAAPASSRHEGVPLRF